MQDEDPDLKLVRALAEGDEAAQRHALATLFDRHHGRVLNVAWRVTGKHSDAEDVVQEVFLGLARGVLGFRGTASFTSWLYRVTVNRAIDRLRRGARRPAVRMPVQDPSEHTRDGIGPPPGKDPTQEGMRQDRDRLIHEALEDLSPKLRAILALRYFEGLSYEDLADVLDCSLGTVKSRIFRAHAAMSEALARRGLGGGDGPEVSP